MTREAGVFSFGSSLRIDYPANLIWAYLVAFEQVPLWERGVVEVRQVTPGQPEVGTRITARRIYAGPETVLAAHGGRPVVARHAAWRESLLPARNGPPSQIGGPLDAVVPRDLLSGSECWPKVI